MAQCFCQLCVPDMGYAAPLPLVEVLECRVIQATSASLPDNLAGDEADSALTEQVPTSEGH